MAAAVGIGDEVAGWVIQDLLGSGAMGEVFLARHPRLPRTDVLKVIRYQIANDDTYRLRFLREAEAICSLEHPNVVAVRDRGEYQGLLYIAMQHVPGGDLRRFLNESGALPLATASGITHQVASALDSAHSHGLVHRDVKPENILLMTIEDEEGPHAFLADFGISRLCAQATALTQQGEVLATPAYAAPEIVLGHQSDGRVDQYALACVAFEMLTGSVPFPRENAVAHFYAHVNAALPSVREHRPELPAVVDGLLARALAKNPDDRFDSCREFSGQLRDALMPLADAPRPTVRPSRIRRVSRRGSRAPLDSPALRASSGGAPAGRRPGSGSTRKVVPIGVAVLALLIASVTWARLSTNDPRRPPPPVPGVPALVHPSTTRGGTLELSTPLDCNGWDPQFGERDNNCANLQRLMSRQLVSFAPGPGKPRLVPDLAENLPAPLDERTFTYHLRPNLQYEDGSPIRAEDIKHGVERLFATELGDNSLPSVAVAALAGGRSYRGPFADGDLATIETPDPLTITFHLAQPLHEWNQLMALPWSTPVPADKDTKRDYGLHPLASGPYKIAVYAKGEQLLLDRNPHWDSSTDQARTGLPDQVHVRVALNRSQRLRALETGQSDADLGTFDANLLATASTGSGLAERQFAVQGYGTALLAINSDVAPLNDVHCRRAVAWALDRTALQASGLTGVPGGVATRILPQQLAGDAGAPDVYQSNNSSGDVQKARAELSQCTRPAGFAVNLRLEAPTQDGARALIAHLGELGIQVEVKLGAVGDRESDQRDGIGLSLFQASAQWPTPAGVFLPLTDPTSLERATTMNLSAVTDPDVQADVNGGVTTTTDAGRQQAWNDLDTLLQEKAYYIPVEVVKFPLVYSARLTNVYVSDFLGDLNFATLGVR